MSIKQEITSRNPANGQVIWCGNMSTDDDIDLAVQSSKRYQKNWAKVSLEEKKEIISNFASLVEKNTEEAARIISEENGKPFWEAKMEVRSLINKVNVVFDAYDERAKTKVKELANGRKSLTRYRPHGVLAVLGPFNFPMSMPNSHIMPALYAGNTVVFKPSERTIKSALFYRNLWIEAGLPMDALKIVIGDSKVGSNLVEHPDIKGVLFIGSRRAGKEIEKKAIAFDKLCVLEMGGNSPLIVWDYSDVRAAVNIAIQSAYISSGQRCSAARRLIVRKGIYEEFINVLSKAVDKIVVNKPFCEDPVPFMGPMIDEKAVDLFMDGYKQLLNKGATALVPARVLSEIGENFVKPSLVDVTNIDCDDEEIFGPLLQIISVNTLQEAIEVANRTQYGLAAGIVTEDPSVYDFFFENIEAGIVNWNQSLTGSTTIAPFGGVKGSGNYHPAGYLSVDYCVYGCASIEAPISKAPNDLSPGLDF